MFAFYSPLPPPSPPPISSLNSSCCRFQWLWFIFPCIPLRRVLLPLLHNPPLGTKDCKQNPISLLACKLNKPSSLSFFVYLYKSYICVYIMYCSAIPILVTFCWTLSSFSLSREQNRTLHSRCSLMGARQKGNIISFGPLTTFLPTETCWWLVLLPQWHIPVSCPGCCPPEPPDCRPAVLLDSPQPILLDGIIPSQEGFAFVFLFFIWLEKASVRTSSLMFTSFFFKQS